MFTPEKQRRFFKRKLRRIYQLLCSVRGPEIDAEILHDIRVSCKHLKALVALVNYCNKDNNRISLKKLDPLFKLAGNIRNSQLILLHLENQLVACNSLINEHRSIVDLGSAELYLRKGEFKTDIKELQDETIFLQPLPFNKIIGFYKRETQKLRFIFSLPEDITLLHECRKIIKGMLLPLPVLPESINNRISIDKQWLNDIEKRIGDLHDEVIIIELMNNKLCSEGIKLKLTDKIILLFYSIVRDSFSINNKTDPGHDSSSCLWVN